MNIKEEFKNRKLRYQFFGGITAFILPIIVWYALEIEQWWPIITFLVFTVIIEIHNIYSMFTEKNNRKFKIDKKI